MNIDDKKTYVKKKKNNRRLGNVNPILVGLC